MGGGDLTDNSKLPSGYGAWHINADFGLYSLIHFTTCPSRISVACCPPSDLNRVIFMDTQKSPLQPEVPSWTPPPPQAPSPPAAIKDSKPPSPQKNDIAGVSSSSSPEIKSAPPLLRKLLDCARLVESKPDHAMKSLIFHFTVQSIFFFKIKNQNGAVAQIEAK